MKAHAQYFWYVLRHKWFVFIAGLKTGAPLRNLIVHDWSKFTPAEWTPYVNQFYRKDRKVAGDFEKAWLHHWHHNSHHWQHWLDIKWDGSTRKLPMPESLVREMVADWMGAGRAITGKWEVHEWYDTNKDKIILHEDTRIMVEYLLEYAVS